MVNLFFLKTFIDVAKTGSVRESAVKNCVSQPAVTQQIRLLEEKLGCRLFERHNKKMTPTTCGKIFLSYAENILGQYEESKIRMREVSKDLVGTIRIATIYSIGIYELQPIIQDYLRRFPKMDISLEYHAFDQIYDMVYNHRVDFGFVSFPKERRGIISEVFENEKMVLTQSGSNKTIHKKKIHLKELNSTKFVAFSSLTPTRVAIDNYLNHHSVRPLVLSEYDNVETLKSALQLGIGCSIVPEITIARELREGSLQIIPVNNLHMKRPLGILYLKSTLGTKSLEAFHNAVLKKKSNTPNKNP